MAAPVAKTEVTMLSQVGACQYGCQGLVVLSVVTPHGVAGQVFSEFPAGIDPLKHPTGPHYQMLWGSRDPDGTVFEAPALGAHQCYLVSHLANRAANRASS